MTPKELSFKRECKKLQGEIERLQHQYNMEVAPGQIQRFEVKEQAHWEVKKDTRPGLSRAIFNAAMHTAKKISSERELRRLQWNI